MKTTIRTFVKKISFAFLVAAAFVLPSCNIGLGEALDLRGPTVTITSPEARQNVKDKFTIAGTVTDDFDIGRVTVTIKYEKEVRAEWRNEKGRWAYRAASSGDYSDWGNATWELSDDGRSVKWSIKDANPAGAGVFTITVSATDGAGNSSDESTKSRDVIIDATPPSITIGLPKLVDTKDELVVDPNDPNNYRDITKINMFMTGDFTIEGYTKDDNTIKFVDLYIKDAETEALYFQKRIDDTMFDSLRAWEMPVKLNECGLGELDSKRHILKIYTNTGDAAGNTNDDLIFQGYTCLWLDADKPWIAFPELEGMDGSSDAKTKSVYSGSPIQGTAYDDAGISKVTVTVYEEDGTTIVKKGTGENEVKYEDYVLYEATGSEMDNNVPFDLETPEDCKKYKIILKAWDNNGKQSDDVEGWIYVEDKTYPAVEITYSDGHSNTGAVGNKTGSDTLLGDRNGNFTLNIRALDDTQVSEVRMIRITDPSQILNYSNAKWGCDANGKLGTTEGWGLVPKIDTLALTNEVDNTIKGLTRKVFKAYKKMNIFSTGADDGLGIDGTTGKLLGNQTFVFRVEDNNGNATTRTFTIQGDVDAPVIEFTKIEYSQNGDASYKEYKNNKETLGAFGIKSWVKIYGTIEDNSAKIWGCDKAFNFTQGEKRFEIKINNTSVKNFTTSNESNGKIEFVAQANDLSGASLIFDASLKDYANNSSNKKWSFLSDTQTPKVEYISSTTDNGNYGKYKDNNTATPQEIDIHIRFNMPLMFEGSTSPELTLNNGGKATLKNGNSDLKKAQNEFHFTYNVASGGTDTEALYVKDIDLKGCTIVKDDGVTSSGLGKTELLAAPNLNSIKKICIIINNPQLNSINLNETTGVLTLTYSKNVAKGDGNVTITQQKVKSKTGNNIVYEDGIEKVPAVLSDSEYRTLYAKNSAFATYYESSTNGADSSFNADMTAKYVLKYQYNSNGTEDKENNTTATTDLITIYQNAGAHKLTQSVKSNKVTVSGNKIEIKFDVNKDSKSCLPCKGAKYKIVVPSGFANDANGGDSFQATERSETITAAGIEKPVIRVSTEGTKVTLSGNTKNDRFKAEQPKTAKFKVDCETPEVNLTYKYDEIIHNERKVQPTEYGNGESIDPVPADSKKTGKNKDSTSCDIGQEISIGTDLIEGNEYKITAVATSEDGKKTATAYQKAARTVIRIDRIAYRLEERGSSNQRMYINYDGTNGKANTGWDGNKDIGLFIRGGDTVQGANSTQGLPLEWDTAKTTKIAMLTKVGNYYNDRDDDDYYYYMSWNINVPKFYFAFIAGICDNKTLTANGGEGPQYFCYGQNCTLSTYQKYYVAAGEYVRIFNRTTNDNPVENDRATNSEFCVHEVGKPVKVRDYVAPTGGVQTYNENPSIYTLSLRKDDWRTGGWGGNREWKNVNNQLEVTLKAWEAFQYSEDPIPYIKDFKTLTIKLKCDAQLGRFEVNGVKIYDENHKYQYVENGESKESNNLEKGDHTVIIKLADREIDHNEKISIFIQSSDDQTITIKEVTLSKN